MLTLPGFLRLVVILLLLVSAAPCVLPVVYRIWTSARMVQLEILGRVVGVLLRHGVPLLWVLRRLLLVPCALMCTSLSLMS